jgi:hypothetical protein
MSMRKSSAATSSARDGIVIGYDLDTRRRVLLSAAARRTHVHVIGSSGTGKTRLLEHMIHEDILARRGLCLIDPTGNLYDHIVGWLARNPRLDRAVVLLNPGEDDYVTGYNPLRHSAKDLSLRVEEIVKACAKVWGADNMNATPLLKKCLRMIFTVLAHRELSLLEAEHLINPNGVDLRSYLAGPLAGTILGTQWEFYNEEDRVKQFFADFSSSINRLVEFLTSPRIARMFGQTEHTIDIRQIMDSGGILLVNLTRRFLSQDSARLLGTLLVNDFYLTATERPEGARPFYLYIDECWQFINEDIGRILDECRQFGLHLILSHQHLAQLKEAGEAVYMAVRTDAKTKVIFGGLAPEDARTLAEQVYMGEFDPDEIKHELAHTFEHHRLKWMDIVAQSHGDTAVSGGSHEDGRDGRPGRDTSQWSAASTDTQTVTHSPFLIPEEDSELSSVQFRDLSEQLYRAMDTMVNQPTQHAILKVLTATTRAIRVPDVPDLFVRSSRLRAYEIARYTSVPFCQPAAEADRIIAERTKQLKHQARQFAAQAAADVHSPEHDIRPTRQPKRGATVSLNLFPGEEKPSPRKKRDEKPA